MSINTSDLNNEREVLVKDFEALQSRIKQVDQELIQMKSNLNILWIYLKNHQDNHQICRIYNLNNIQFSLKYLVQV